MNDFLDQPNHPTTLFIVNHLNRIRLNRLTPQWPQLVPGSSCGSELRDALREFQKAHGLSPTGFYDWQTERMLFNYVQDISYGTNNVEKKLLDEMEGKGYLRQGMDADEIFILQHKDEFISIGSDMASIIESGTNAMEEYAKHNKKVNADAAKARAAQALAQREAAAKAAQARMDKLLKAMREFTPPDDSPIWKQVDRTNVKPRTRPNSANLQKDIAELGKKVGKGEVAKTTASSVSKGSKILGILKHAGVAGYVLQVTGLAIDYSVYANADPINKDQAKRDFMDAVGSCMCGIMASAALGAIGGVPGIIAGIVYAVVDLVVLGITGKSLSTHFWEFSNECIQKAFKPLAYDMVNWNSGGLFSQLGLNL